MRLLVFIALLFGLMACGSVDIEEYQDSGPELVLSRFFEGELKAYGMVQDYQGLVTRRFVVTMTGTWQDGVGILDEDFVYDDGETQKRIWTLTELGNGAYQGRADDIIGVASGQAVGSALRWRYDMLLPVDGQEYQVHFDDWMYLIDDTTLINKSDIIKFGVTVATVTLVIQKQG
ncbi:DUF3833 domain-containing protein [Shewanella sp. NIFS-20-20]|uniref:DUF3833 domain-containing protein n=1 Tax=Shewanella sp. NIFS-20-20 TaxID=2853806 RepID=UPI001C448C38|nr:DUF3833 domain-containing protein [Shewanella sp. NIFS-20-20]MBV7314515.1 DUF3833 domain-containing protein [Shewanella sp. NIFS-20-20]